MVKEVPGQFDNRLPIRTKTLRLDKLENISLTKNGGHRTVERGGVTRVVTRGPGALRGPVENRVCIFGYEFSISSIGRAGP